MIGKKAIAAEHSNGNRNHRGLHFALHAPTLKVGEATAPRLRRQYPVGAWGRSPQEAEAFCHKSPMKLQDFFAYKMRLA